MARSMMLLAGLLGVLGVAGCVNVRADKPLVDLGGSQYRPAPAGDPAPGVPDEQLTDKQRLQRELARCRQAVQARDKQIAELRRDREGDKKQFEDKLRKLEQENEKLSDKIESLESRLEKLQDRR